MSKTSAQVISLEANAVVLSRRADHIRKLMNDMSRNALAIGRELAEARAAFPLGPYGEPMGWKKWVKAEFDLSVNWTAGLILAYKKFGERAQSASVLPGARVLVYLAQHSTPEAARKEVLDRVTKGEHVTTRKAKKIVQKYLPSPKKANEIAKTTGKPTVASDGYVYLGADAKDVKQSAERRTVVYAVRDAVSCLASINLTAAEFLEYAMPHQLWKAKEEHEIKDALDWLMALSKAWNKQR